MAAPRKRTRTARPATVPDTVPAEQPPGALTDTEQEADRNAAAARAAHDAPSEPAVVPVQRVRIAPAEPVRAGGYVLTERGWVLDPDRGED